MKKQILIILVAVIALSCGENKKSSESSNSEMLSGTIQVDGSSTVFPVTEAVAEEYRTEQPDVKVTIGPCVNLNNLSIKRVKRKSVQLVKKPKT